MSEEFMVTEVLITRGRRRLNDDRSWTWVDPEDNLVKRGIVMQKKDNVDRSFLDALHLSITDIMGKLFEDWKIRKELRPVRKPILKAVRDAIELRKD